MARTKAQCNHWQRGFTLIEMLVSMSMGLVIIGGLTMVFMSNSNVSRVISSQTEIMGDLYLASHLIQAGLRGSVGVTAPIPSFPADLQSNGRFTRDSKTGGCTASTASVSKPNNYPTSFTSYPYWDSVSQTLTYQDIDGNTGIIQYQRSAKDSIYWLRPDPCVSQFQELIRGMDLNSGMNATVSASGEVNVTLVAAYVNEQKQTRTLSLSFKTWPRNK